MRKRVGSLKLTKRVLRGREAKKKILPMQTSTIVRESHNNEKYLLTIQFLEKNDKSAAKDKNKVKVPIAINAFFYFNSEFVPKIKE
jgi:hypothetical protein